MREFRIVFVFVCFLGLLGCAVSKVDATKMDVSAIQFSERLVKEMSNKLDKLVTPLRAQKLETQQYKVYHNKFFPIAGGEKGVRESLASYCTMVGGRFNDGACEDAQENLIFYARVKFTGNYGGYKEITLTVIEPANFSDQEFLSKAQELGYERAWVKQARQQYAAQVAREEYEREMVEKEREAKMITAMGRGTKVCKQNRNYNYVGFVEDVTEQNIKIFVQTIHMIGSPGLQPGGFKPYITWEPARDWYRC